MECKANGKFGLNFTRCGFDFEKEIEETNPQFCNQWKRCEVNGILSIYPQYWRYVAKTSDSFAVKGRLNSYPGGGYVVDIGGSKLDTDKVSIRKYCMKVKWLYFTSFMN